MVYTYHIAGFDEPVRISLRGASTTVAAGGTFTFDAEGRLLTASRGDRFYKRGLDHRVMEKRRTWTLGRRDYLRRDVGDDEKRALVRAAGRTAARVAAALPPDAPWSLRRRLDGITAWTPERYAADRRRYDAVYRPVGILPPDQYMALVLQATEGCHYNRCTFCALYRDVPFRIKDAPAFRAHIDAVRRFLGSGVGLRRSVFLADANALVVPQDRLLPLFDAVHDAFEVAPAGLEGRALAQWKADHPGGVTGLYSFVDAFTGTRKTADDFAALAARGLRRVYIGMESGHVPLLHFLDKPSMPDEVRHLTAAAKAAGVGVGLIVMLGIGGARYDAGHVADTAAVVGSLGLGAGDLLYLSEYVEEAGADYAERARAEGIRALTGAEVARQGERLRAALTLDGAVKVAAYDVREFIY